MVQEIRIKNVNTKKQEEAIEKLLKQNKMVSKKLNIIRVTCFKNVNRLKKEIFSLIIETEFSKKINKVIFENFFKKITKKCDDICNKM